ncbi:hypothetical protein ACFQ0K_13720 [Nocardioides caeni]|uniref:hypothetical protein n=1 Tax=Nocardioides caeni TaxID=574700 RepID=UPI0031EA27A9
MSRRQRIAAFVVALAAVLALAIGIGRWVGPIATDDEDDHAHDDRTVLTPDDPDDSDDSGDAGDAAAAPPTTLDLERTVHDAGRQRLAFTIRDAAGEPVTSYDVVHEKRLHLVVVRTDLGGYRHVHPRLDAATGQWAVDVDLDTGSWRVYADFTPTGGAATIAQADLQVAGDFTPVELGADDATAEVDGYEVHLARDGDELALHVSRDGAPVTDLEPHLGAYGHLVAIRAADLAYLHVHPEEGEAGPGVAFHAALDQAGRYRLFFEFSHAGAVHRAELTLTADVPGDSGHNDGTDHSGGADDEHEEGDGDEHDH